MKKKWLGKKECDFCGVTESEFFVDGIVKGRSSWAFMCSDCWLKYSTGQLGTGYGQQYNGETLEKISG